MSATGISTSAAEDTQLRILIVDEEEALRLLCRDIAVSLGMSVEIANTTQDAFDAVARHSFDLGVTNFRVPENGGTELTKHIRATQPDAGSRTTQIVLVGAERVGAEESLDAVLY
jgi:two-component system, NarL family, sensor histidine kinase BarA